MLQIPCPYCGYRDETEFAFGGEGHRVRPTINCSDAKWADYLFNRENPIGIHHERWIHSYGCGRWFIIARDTVTHEAHAAYLIGEPKPSLKGEDDR